MKGKKPQRVARKLKPMKPVVGIPQPIAKPVKANWLKTLLDKLFGDKKEDKPQVNRKNNTRKRKRNPSKAKKNPPTAKVDVKKDEQPVKAEGEEGQKRRRRRRRRPAKDKAGQQQNNQQQASSQEGDKAPSTKKEQPASTEA